MEKFKQFENGYYKYSVTFTFRDDTEYSKLNPVKAQKLFKDKITKYMDKRDIKYELHPEISSKNGRFHYHGVLIFKSINNDYKAHERVLKLFKNYCTRTFGMQYWQIISTFQGSYPVYDITFHCKGRTLNTSFEAVYKYITKDQDQFPYLKQIIRL